MSQKVREGDCGKTRESLGQLVKSLDYRVLSRGQHMHRKRMRGQQQWAGLQGTRMPVPVPPRSSLIALTKSRDPTGGLRPLPNKTLQSDVDLKEEAW